MRDSLNLLLPSLSFLKLLSTQGLSPYKVLSEEVFSIVAPPSPCPPLSEWFFKNWWFPAAVSWLLLLPMVLASPQQQSMRKVFNWFRSILLYVLTIRC